MVIVILFYTSDGVKALYDYTIARKMVIKNTAKKPSQTQLHLPKDQPKIYQ